MATRNGITPPSPSATIYSNASGFSAYRDPYRPPLNAPPLPTNTMNTSSPAAFKVFYDQLRGYLGSDDRAEMPGARSDPRSKLVRLNETQFHELSTDVHDECMRRNSPNPTPFLPVRTELHPKRNQARQKLATLSKAKFRDLASDIFFELCRRFPRFRDTKEAPDTPESNYGDDTPVDLKPPVYYTPNAGLSSSSISKPPLEKDPNFAQTPNFAPTPPPYRLENPFDPSPASSRPDQRKPSASSAASSRTDPRRTPSEEQDSSSVRRRPSEEQSRPAGRPSLEQQQPGGPSSWRRAEEQPAPAGRPSLEQQAVPGVWRRPSDQSNQVAPAIWRRPSDQSNQDAEARRIPPVEPLSLRSDRPRPSLEAPFSPPPTSTATLGVVNPNKSTMAEEEIEVPYGKDESDDRPLSATSTSTTDEKSPPTEPTTGRLGGGGLSALATGFEKRMMQRSPDLDEDEGDMSTASRGVSEFYDKMSFGRASVASGMSGKNGRHDRESMENDAVEKIRREYEFKVATMQNRITSLESEVADAFKARDASEDTVRNTQEELAKLRIRADDQASSMRGLREQLEEARSTQSLEKDRSEQRIQAYEGEIRQLRDRCHQLDTELASKAPDNSAAVENLRAEAQALVTELGELQERNEEMMAEKDNDANIIRDLNAQIKEWKRKYESAKTELRHLKATSQLAMPQLPRGNDDHLPVSEQGAIADVHLTAFQSSIDALLAAGRSNAPTSVLTAMKSVVTSVAAITDDVRTFELRPRKDKMGVDDELVRSLKDRASATLNNLVMASKNHGTSYGLSPVSLLDAAASHVSSTIVEIVKILKVRKGTRTFLDRAGSATAGSKAYSPALRSVSEQSSNDRVARSPSAASASKDMGSGADRNSGPSPIRTSSRRKSNISGDSHHGLPTPDRSSSTNSPQLASFESMIPKRQPSMTASQEVVPTEGSDDAWEELKPYLEAQSESIVYSIQSVLSAIRGGASGPELNENLTQIITIVSSIVAVCKDSLPTGAARQGQELLQVLSEHCNTLSEAQVSGESDKQSRQAMATASFGVAKALKELMKL